MYSTPAGAQYKMHHHSQPRRFPGLFRLKSDAYRRYCTNDRIISLSHAMKVYGEWKYSSM